MGHLHHIRRVKASIAPVSAKKHRKTVRFADLQRSFLRRNAVGAENARARHPGSKATNLGASYRRRHGRDV
jgi:hypothetical protein